MSEHKFTYTVSGVHLSEDDKKRISQAIGVAVADALVAQAPGTVRSDFLSVFRINGGRWLDAKVAEDLGLDRVLSNPAVE